MRTQKIVIAGGTGFIGRTMAAYFGREAEVVLLSRQQNEKNNAYTASDPSAPNARVVHWDGRSRGEWWSEIDGADLVINLAGKSVNCRYTEKNKQQIFDSRVFATKAIGDAVRATARPPALWLNAASATTYRHALDRPQDEYTGEMHNDFSVQVCKLWEKTFFEQQTPSTRKVVMRMAIALGHGGVMVPYLHLVRWGLGGRQGSGQQMYSWIHIEDVCRFVEWIGERKDLEGVFNLSAPNPVTNAAFMKAVRQAAGVRFGLPAPAWMLRIGAAIIGTETELLLKSRWVVPTRLLKEGFRFKYERVEEALQEIVKGKKKTSQFVAAQTLS